MFFCQKRKKAGTLYISQAGSEPQTFLSQPPKFKVPGVHHLSNLRYSVTAHSDPVPVTLPDDVPTSHTSEVQKTQHHHISFDRGSCENKIPGAHCSSEVGCRLSSCKARVQTPAPSIQATTNKTATD